MQKKCEQKYLIEKMLRSHQRKTFCCGVNELDNYLHKQSGQEERKNIAVTYVLADEEAKKVVGYYTLSAMTIELVDLPDPILKKLPHYPLVPTTLIGRLAIDKHYQKQGFGELLLLDVLHRSYQTSKNVASFAVVVDAINDNAVAFYEKHGFLRLLAKKERLYLPMQTIRKIYPSY